MLSTSDMKLFKHGVGSVTALLRIALHHCEDRTMEERIAPLLVEEYWFYRNVQYYFFGKSQGI